MVKTHVRISANFDRTLDGVKAFLEEAEAGLTFPALLDALFDRLIPNLQRHPRLGRDFLARTAGSVEGRMIHQRLSRQIGKSELREYILGDYLVLYLVEANDVTLLAIKHHRQLSFDLPMFWA